MNELQSIPPEWLEEAIRWDGTTYKSGDDEIRAIYTAIGELDRDIQRIQFYNARLMSALNP